MRLVTPLVVSLVLAGCFSSDEPAPTIDLGPTIRLDSGFGWYTDQYVYPGQWDLYLPPDSAPADSGTNGAGADGGSCKPSSATCLGACQTDQVCSPAGGGRCVKRQALVGDAAKKQVLADLARACVTCWFSYPGQTKTCAALDTCQMSGTVQSGALETFVCQTAFPADLPGDTYQKAQEVLNCGTQKKPVIGINRLEWKVGAIAPGEAARVCVVYEHNGGWGQDRLQIRLCSNSP